MIKMFCNPCKYKKINRIKFYNTILEECDDCEFASISIIDYPNFIKNAIIFNNFLGINVFTIIDTLPFKDQTKYELLNKCFFIDLSKANKTNNICRICNEKLYEIKKDKNFSLYFCETCMTVFFNRKEFKKYIEKNIKFINKFYYFIIIKKRFLHLFKGGKNNVKK